MNCRHCQHELTLQLVDLGVMPPSNAYLTIAADFNKERRYPLKVWVCQNCWLVQTQDFTRADELFTEDYAYFSSTSVSWLQHAASYAEQVILAQQLSQTSFVVEIAANDGYLLRNFHAAGIPCLGIEPTKATADAARSLGLNIISDFFGVSLASVILEQDRKADLIIANNVLAHVPDINDFVAGIALLLAENGVCSFEFPHLLNLLNERQFDTIYHEHFSYLSLRSCKLILAQVGLNIYKVEHLETHGGSLRVWAAHFEAGRMPEQSVTDMVQLEDSFGLNCVDIYASFQAEVDNMAADLKSFLLEQKRQGKVVVAYGAAAKGNTLLNYAGITVDLLPVVFDAAPSKQGKFLPGSHIPIKHPSELTSLKPEVVLILPWNISHEICRLLEPLLEASCELVVAVPKLTVL